MFDPFLEYISLGTKSKHGGYILDATLQRQCCSDEFKCFCLQTMNDVYSENLSPVKVHLYRYRVYLTIYEHRNKAT